MIPTERKKLVCDLVDKLKEEYDTIDSNSIADIAKKYGGVKTITKTPLMDQTSCLVPDENTDYHIFHYSPLPFCERFNLAHETGHALLHTNIHGTLSIKEAFQYEFEADLFATRLCSIPRSSPYIYQYLANGLGGLVTKISNLFRASSEINRLKNLGVYDVLEYNKLVGGGSPNQSKSSKIRNAICYFIVASSSGSVVGGLIDPEIGHYVGAGMGAISFLSYQIKKEFKK